jgi:hypothetical protein
VRALVASGLAWLGDIATFDDILWGKAEESAIFERNASDLRLDFGGVWLEVADAHR